MRFFTLARNPSQKFLGIPSQKKSSQNQKKSREQLQNPNRLGISRAATRNSKMEKSQFFKISLEIQNEIMTPKSEFGSRVKFFFWKFSLEMIEFILIRNPNEILREIFGFQQNTQEKLGNMRSHRLVLKLRYGFYSIIY